MQHFQFSKGNIRLAFCIIPATVLISSNIPTKLQKTVWKTNCNKINKIATAQQKLKAPGQNMMLQKQTVFNAILHNKLKQTK